MKAFVPFGSILCPVDFSPESRSALAYAAALARRFGGRVTVMFVNEPVLLAAANAYRGNRRFVERTRTELSRFVKQALAGGRGDLERIALTVAAGNPSDEILRQAAMQHADVVVMGSHGLGGIQKAFFGSTTEQVLRHATLPVLATPPVRSRRTVTAAAGFAHVVAPIDLSGEWHSDAVRAARIAEAFDAALVLVHVLAPVQRPPWFGYPDVRTEARRIEKAKRALEHVRAELFSHVNSTSAVVIGNPAHEIARMTSRGGSLVVMSLRGTAGVWGARRGSIAYDVLSHAATPVLALPRRRVGGPLPARVRKALHDRLSARDRTEIAGIDALLSVGSGGRRVRR